jgi:hypothetical protein
MLIDKLQEKIKTFYFQNGNKKSEILDGSNYVMYWGNGSIKSEMIGGVYKEYNYEGIQTWPKKLDQ